MKPLRQFGAILLLLVSTVAPAMACMAFDVQMTVEERACCRMMKSKCGQMEMPSSQQCCKKASTSDQDNALKTEAVSHRPVVFVAARTACSQVPGTEGANCGWLHHPEFSPPKSPPSAIVILRI